MEKLLDQDQIDAMFRSARGHSSSPNAVVDTGPQLLVTAYDVRQSTQLTKEQVRSVTALHEGVCRNLSHSLGAYLRVMLEAAVVSVEQLTYAEFLGRLPDVTYLCSLNVAPLSAVGVLQLDLQMAFPLIDILLGGQGQPVNEVREATEIEEELLEGIVRLISRDLDTAWSSAGINISFDERQLPASVQRLFSPTEKTLVINFELRMAQIRGVLNLAFPAVVANTLLRKLLRENPSRLGSRPHSEVALREVLAGCQFDVTLQTRKISVRFRELIELAPGKVLPLTHDIREQLVIAIGNQELFCARPVKTFRKRAAQLVGWTQKQLAEKCEEPNGH